MGGSRPDRTAVHLHLDGAGDADRTEGDRPDGGAGLDQHDRALRDDAEPRGVEGNLDAGGAWAATSTGPVGSTSPSAPDHRGDDGAAALDPRGRRHRRPGMAGDRGPAAFGLGQHGIDGAGGDVAPQHLVEAVPLLLDDTHPRSQRALAVLGEPVHPAGLPGLRHARPRLDQAVALELAERAVDARTIDPAEAELLEALGQVVAVAGSSESSRSKAGSRKWRGGASSKRECWAAVHAASAARCSIGPPGPARAG